MSTTAHTIGQVTTSSKRVPSRAWYWLAVAIMVGGLVAGVAWGVASTVQAHDRADALPRTGVPGQLTVTGEGGESLLVFYEGGGKPAPGDVGLRVTAPDGSSVPVVPYDLELHYDIAGWSGTPIASFPTHLDGTYTVSADRPYGRGDIAAGEDFVWTQALQIIAALGLIAATFVAGVIIVVVVGVRRSRTT
jgi:hypothetical protein